MFSNKRSAVALATRVAGFGLAPALSLVSPLVLLPLLARSVGVDEWVAIAIGQSVGVFGAIVVNAGWSLAGPVRVARAPAGEREALWIVSLRQRLLLLLVVGPAASAVAWVLAPDGGSAEPLGAMIAAATCVAGLSLSWFAIGLGRPSLIARYEAIPRVVSVLATSGVLAVGGHIFWYPCISIAVDCSMLWRFTRREAKNQPFRWKPPKGGAGQGKGQVASAITEISAGAYSALSTAIVSVNATAGSMVAYSSAARTYQFGLIAVTVLSQALQGWVAAPDASRDRVKSALIFHVALGVCGGAALAALGAGVSAVLFGAELAATSSIMAAFGLSFAAVSLSTSLGRHVLIPSGAKRAVLRATLAGAILGTPGLLLIPSQFGGEGGAWVLAGSQVVVVLVMLRPASRALAAW